MDLQLRPSGRAGPVAVSLQAYRDYYARDAATWEALALTRARVAWASSPAIFAATTDAILSRPSATPATPPAPPATCARCAR